MTLGSSRRRGVSRGARLRRGAALGALALVLVVGLAAALVAATGTYGQLERRFRPTTPGATPYVELFRAASARYPEVSAAQLAAQARAESGFDPEAVSSAGAQGLMQIIPATFERFAVDGDGDGRTDPFAPADSVFTAAAYLTWLGEELGLDVADERVLAAYNAGPGAVRRAGGVPDYPETRTYVERVTGWIPDYAWLDRPAAE